MNKKWQIYETDESKIKEIEEKYQINKLLATILTNRNITQEEEIRLFLEPTRNDFHDPFLITDMKKADSFTDFSAFVALRRTMRISLCFPNRLRTK